jgi:succinate dehydrogenase / fumarate reductase, cytochrome b subunit
MALSILHRATGVALIGALMAIILWLWAAAYDSVLFYSLNTLLQSKAGMALLAVATAVFYFKCATGLRHLWWNTGRGFQLKSIDATGVAAIGFTVIATALTWAFVCRELY